MEVNNTKWKKMDRDLKKGEIIRFKAKNPPNPPKDHDGYIYGRATGGFGMSVDTIGNAIFIENEAWTYEDCLNKKSADSVRWERFWGIEIIAET